MPTTEHTNPTEPTYYACTGLRHREEQHPMSNQPTAADRIAEQMKGRADDLADLLARMATADYDEEAHDDYHALPLSVEVVRTIRVLLSTGGPADGLTIDLNTDGLVTKVRYWFSDWFDHAETSVEPGTPLWSYAEDLAEMLEPGCDC